MNIFVQLIGLVSRLTSLLFISFMFSWPVMALWNGCLVDAVVGVKEIGWLQGWGISFLSGLLFKSNRVN